MVALFEVDIYRNSLIIYFMMIKTHKEFRFRITYTKRDITRFIN